MQLEKGKIRSIDSESTKLSLTFQSSPSVTHSVDEVDIFPHGYLPLLYVPSQSIRNCTNGLMEYSQGDGCALACWTLGDKNVSAMQYLRPLESIRYCSSEQTQQQDANQNNERSTVYYNLLRKLATSTITQFEQLLEQKRILLRACTELREKAEQDNPEERKEKYHTSITWLLLCLDMVDSRMENVEVSKAKLMDLQNELQLEDRVGESSLRTSSTLNSWQTAKAEVLVAASRWSATKGIPDVVHQIAVSQAP